VKGIGLQAAVIGAEVEAALDEHVDVRLSA
jgi:hypothetical protein